jgi:hypothetical protein
MAELLIRAGLNDHLVVADLLAPSAGPRLVTNRPSFSQLVADAHVARARPVLCELTQSAGIPYLIDPDTHFLQTEVADDDKWAQLPFAIAVSLAPREIDTRRLVAEVVTFQLEQGATAIVPPYFYASSPTDPWFVLSLSLIDETANFMAENNVRLPLLPLLCSQLQTFCNHLLWPLGLDRFIERTKSVNAKSAALCFSPSGSGQDSYAKVHRLFHAMIHLKESGLRVIAWRQGVYGPGLVAAGLDGYECGMGTSEQTNISGQQAGRKPRDKDDRQRGGGSGVFIETLGRSVPRRVGNALFADAKMRAKVMCDDEGCCGTYAKTLEKPREHAVRSRSRLLDNLVQQPAIRWRLNHVSQEAASAATLATQANRVLEAAGMKERISVQSAEALARVARELAESASNNRIA